MKTASWTAKKAGETDITATIQRQTAKIQCMCTRHPKRRAERHEGTIARATLSSL
jgi:hypothetical protein